MPEPIQPSSHGNVVPDLSRLNVLRQGAGDGARPESAGNTKPRDAADVSASLAQVKSLLAELDKASNEAAQSGDPGAAARQKVDDIIASIDAVVAGAKPGGAAGGGPGYSIENVNEAVRKYSVQHADLGSTGSLDVQIEVTQSAQQAAQYLSFGGLALDLEQPNSTFAIEVTGRRGSQQLSFASGTAVADVTAAINAFTDQTGVHATHQGNGVLLESEQFGREEFVSIQIVDDGNWAGPAQAGVYQVRARNAQAPDPTTRIAFGGAAAFRGQSDQGQDIQGTVNGELATGRGFILHVDVPTLRARIALSATEGEVNAQRLGTFTAFTIAKNEGSAASSIAHDVRSSLGLQ